MSSSLVKGLFSLLSLSFFFLPFFFKIGYGCECGGITLCVSDLDKSASELPVITWLMLMDPLPDGGPFGRSLVGVEFGGGLGGGV